MPKERNEAEVALGRHADIVSERKALVDFRDGQDAGSDAGRRRFARTRASPAAASPLPPWTDDDRAPPIGCLPCFRIARTESPRDRVEDAPSSSDAGVSCP